MDGLAVGHAHPDGLAVFDQDFLHVRIGKDFAAALLDHRDNGLGHFRGAAHRIVATIEIMSGDQGVDDKAGVIGHQAVVAPLAGQGSDQFLVAGEGFQYFPGGAVEKVGGLAAGQIPERAGHQVRQYLGQGDTGHGLCHQGEIIQIAVYGLLFTGKLAFQFLGKSLGPGDQIDLAIADKESVVVIVHGRPLQLAVGNIVKQAAGQGVFGAHVANVVNPHIPFVAIAVIAVGEAAGGVVLFEHDHLLAHFAQAGGGGQAANTGADDDGVIGAVQAVGPVTSTNAQGTGCGAAHGLGSLLVVRSMLPSSSRAVMPAASCGSLSGPGRCPSMVSCDSPCTRDQAAAVSKDRGAAFR